MDLVRARSAQIQMMTRRVNRRRPAHSRRNPKRRPICRQRLACGPLVAAQVGVQKVFLSIALAEAKAFACLRTQPSGPVQPTLADGRLTWSLREMAKLCHVEFVDYFITRLDGRDYYSWREHERPVA